MPTAFVQFDRKQRQQKLPTHSMKNTEIERYVQLKWVREGSGKTEGKLPQSNEFSTKNVTISITNMTMNWVWCEKSTNIVWKSTANENRASKYAHKNLKVVCCLTHIHVYNVLSVYVDTHTHTRAYYAKCLSYSATTYNIQFKSLQILFRTLTLDKNIAQYNHCARISEYIFVWTLAPHTNTHITYILN